MKLRFAALDFFADERLSGRIYWYLAPFPLSAGEKVLAPVGAHDRLQCAAVAEVLFAEAEEAPYDVRLIKRIRARLGERKLQAGGEEFVEFGGIRYDEKHYTRFGKILFGRKLPENREELSAYGVTRTLGEGTFEEIAREKGCVLLTGERGEQIFRALVCLVRGEDFQEEACSEQTLRKIKEKLT